RRRQAAVVRERLELRIDRVDVAGSRRAGARIDDEVRAVRRRGAHHEAAVGTALGAGEDRVRIGRRGVDAEEGGARVLGDGRARQADARALDEDGAAEAAAGVAAGAAERLVAGEGRVDRRERRAVHDVDRAAETGAAAAAERGGGAAEGHARA